MSFIFSVCSRTNHTTSSELNGENPFKCRAYHNASRIIGSLSTDVNDLVRGNELRKLKGIGQGLAETIVELASTGTSAYYEELKKSLPEGLVDLLRIQGLGPKRVKLLFDRLKIKNITELKEAAERHKLANISGFGGKLEESILKGIAQLEKHADQHLYSKAEEAALRVFEAIRHLPGVRRGEIAGSLRRRKEVIGDIDILLSAGKKSAEAIMEAFTAHPDVESVLARGATKSSVLLNSSINCDLRIVNDEEYPFALAYFTGNKEHNVAMRTLAKQHGWSLNEYGFSELGSKEKRGKAKRVVTCTTEEHIYHAVGLRYVPPELRENTGEIEAAEHDTIPRLIEESDIRGTFHCHTTYSDGQNTLREMADAARNLGWEYIGIADHSKIAAYAGGLSPERLKLQFKEIDELNKTLKGITVLKGTEVDILIKGTLDWSDGVLSQFDYVVASIHSSFAMSETEATKRVIKAIRNKYVTMLGHPTGRLLLQREGYPVNMNEVIKAAADYGKVIEINSDPHRLDLDWRLCKYAKELGVRVSINPDAHTIHGLRNVHYGVGIARKGWLEKKNVINTMKLKDILTFLQRS
ncbi:MAG: DNA polymerase/3'-5' exonuclease PolX [Ignavibacteriae bacterium]|nr:DNA polymerase/3'-5' exonuclease PolX [Ignavibacteriota bacterium]